MRPANLILVTSKSHYSDEQGLIDLYWGERSFGWHKPAAPLSTTSFDPSTLVITTVAAAPGEFGVPSTILLDSSISGTEIDVYGINLVAGQTYLFSARGTGATPLADTFLYVFDSTLTFAGLLTHVDRRSPVARDVAALVAGRTSRTLPAHKRIDSRRASVDAAVGRGALSLVVSVRGAQHEYATRYALNLVNDLFLLLHEKYPEYLIEHFGVSAE